MRISRRDCLRLGAASLVSAAWSRDRLRAAARAAGFKIGVTDWNLKLTGQIQAVALAKQILRRRAGASAIAAETLPLADPATQRATPRGIGASACRRLGVPDAAPQLPKSDPFGTRRVAGAIPIARALGVRVILLPFFGRGARDDGRNGFRRRHPAWTRGRRKAA
jgi:hypothetical protein